MEWKLRKIIAPYMGLVQGAVVVKFYDPAIIVKCFRIYYFLVVMCQLPTRSPRESDNVSPTRFMLPLNNSRSSSVNDKEKDSARSSRRKLDTLTFDEALDDEHAWSSKDIGRNTISVHPTLI
jgi:hypothetical protein